MFIPTSALLAVHSIYIWLRLGPAAAPLIVRMHIRLRGVAIVYDYSHPAIQFPSSSPLFSFNV